MHVRSHRPWISAAILLPALVLFVPVGPVRAQVNDKLPQGAKARVGVSRPILRTGPGVALVPPTYADFLAPTLSGGIKRYQLATGLPLDDGIVGPGQVVVSADGKRAAVARAGSVKVVDVATSKEILAVEPPLGVILVGIPGCALSADGSVLAIGAQGRNKSGVVVVWDVDKNEQICKVETGQTAPIFPTLAPDGKTLVTHGPPIPAATVKSVAKPMAKVKPEDDAARTAQVWDVATGNELFKARMTGMGGVVAAAAFAPDGELVALSAGDGPIDLWQVATGKRLRTLLGRKGQGVRVAFAPDGKTIASVGPDYRIQRWSVDGTPKEGTEPPHGMLIAQITGLVFADNERVIAWMTSAQLFAVAWEAPASKLLSPSMEHAAAIHSISFGKEQKDVFTSGYDSRVFRWDAGTGILKETLTMNPLRLPGKPHINPVVSLSADSTRGTCLTNPAEVYDLASGECLFCVPPPSTAAAPITMKVSPDGMKLISVSRQTVGQSGSCVVWDLAKRERLAEFEAPATSTASAPAAVASPDGSRLVLATIVLKPNGRQLLVLTGYDLKTGQKLAEVENSAAVGNITYGVADDTHAVAADTSGRVWVVDYVNGKVEPDIDSIPVQAGEAPIWGPLEFSPDGKRFAIGVVGKQFTTYGVRVYDFAQRKLTHTLVGHLGPVSALRFSPDGELLASGAQDTSVLVWDLSKP